jgi:hypothetical protein
MSKITFKVDDMFCTILNTLKDCPFLKDDVCTKYEVDLSYDYESDSMQCFRCLQCKKDYK